MRSQPAETSAAGLQLLSAIDEVARSIGSLADQAQRLRGDSDQEIARTVAAINAELQALDGLNDEIQRLAHLGQINPELLDRRDALIRSLAEKIDLRTYAQGNGTLAIYTAGGETLLDSTLRLLVYDPANLVAPETSFAPIAIFRANQLDPATGQPLDPTADVPTSRSRAGSGAAGSRGCSRFATAPCPSSTTSSRSSPPACASR